MVLDVTFHDGQHYIATQSEAWHELAERTGADVYLCPEWLGLWWKHFGAGRVSVIVEARERGRLVGVLPFCIETLWAGPLPVRIARLAGTDPHCMVLTLTVEPEHRTETLAACFKTLTDSYGVNAISLTPVSEIAGHRINIIEAAVGFDLKQLSGGSHVVFELPKDFETYLASISKKRSSQFRRDIKGLQGHFGMTTDVTQPGIAEFADFVNLHNAQWQAIGKGGHFVDWPGSEQFYSEFAKLSRPGFGVVFDNLKGTKETIATNFCLLAGKAAHWRLPARTTDPEAERLSIGKAGLMIMIGNFIKSGATLIEAGRGEYGYKLSYGGKDLPVHRILIGRTDPLSRLKLKALLAWSDVFNFVYYRAWFVKFSPIVRQKLGGKPKPLWRHWIRTQI